jgi:hypothetical protein
MTVTDKPIGYWLKHLDNLIEAQFDATLSDQLVSRRHWQVLNLLRDAPRSRTEVEQALAPFWTEAGSNLDTILNGANGLIRLGWIASPDDASPDDDALSLTTPGRAAHAEIAARVGETRTRLLRGLRTDQYIETVRILAKMADNVESALAEREAHDAN